MRAPRLQLIGWRLAASASSAQVLPDTATPGTEEQFCDPSAAMNSVYSAIPDCQLVVWLPRTKTTAVIPDACHFHLQGGDCTDRNCRTVIAMTTWCWRLSVSKSTLGFHLTSQVPAAASRGFEFASGPSIISLSIHQDSDPLMQSALEWQRTLLLLGKHQTSCQSFLNFATVPLLLLWTFVALETETSQFLDQAPCSYTQSSGGDKNAWLQLTITDWTVSWLQGMLTFLPWV